MSLLAVHLYRQDFSNNSLCVCVCVCMTTSFQSSRECHFVIFHLFLHGRRKANTHTDTHWQGGFKLNLRSAGKPWQCFRCSPPQTHIHILYIHTYTPRHLFMLDVFSSSDTFNKYTAFTKKVLWYYYSFFGHYH